MRKLGKLSVKHDPRTLKADKYMGAVSPPPVNVDWQSTVPQWNMFGNDNAGDCTFATIGHKVQRWTYNAVNNETTLTDDDIIKGYSAVSGYDPNTGANDNGAYELDVLNYWRNTGVGGHKIVAYVKLDPHNHDQVKQAINLFGSVYIGVALPSTAETQIEHNMVWDVKDGPGSEPGSWGGHAVSVGKYDQTILECVTWGQTQQMTWAWWDKYVDEAYAVLSQDWLSSGKDPQGFDLVTLQQDLVNVGKNQPNVDPTPTPPDPTPPGPTPPEPVVPPLTLVVSDPVLAKKIVSVATKRGLTPDEYNERHWDTYFHVKGRTVEL